MEHKNHWLSIWTRPRATMAQIVFENPDQSFWWLASIYGFCSLMNMFQSMMLGSSLGTAGSLVLAIVLAPLWGWLNFTVWSWFVTFVGKWFKGEGDFRVVRAAYAWSSVPLLVSVVLWFLMLGFFGHQIFLNFPQAHAFSDGQVIFLFVVSIVKVVVTVWSLVIYLNALAEVQHFSILRAIGNVIVAGLILGLIAFVFWSVLAHLLN